MKKSKMTKSEILVNEKDKEYRFDEASLQYASLTDEEAKEKVAELKKRIKDLEGAADLSQDVNKIHELRELKSSLYWLKKNKNRSKYFKIITSGPSMRRAKRHPETNWLGTSNGNSSNRRKSKNRHSRKTVQTTKSLFSKLFGKKQADEKLSNQAI